jgi:hypothetical protein
LPNVGEDRDFERPEDRGRPVENVRRRDSDSAAALDRWLALLGETHGDRVLPIDRPIAEEWGG